jgi:hypothetical protein
MFDLIAGIATARSKNYIQSGKFTPQAPVVKTENDAVLTCLLHAYALRDVVGA